MRIFPDSISCLVLLLLSDLIGLSLSRPAHSHAHSPALCTLFISMVQHVDKLINLSRKLHDLSDVELTLVSGANHRLDSLLEIHHTAAAFSSMKINETLSQLHNFSESYRFHMDWLNTARENVSLPSQPTEGASRHLQQLTHLLDSSLKQLQEEVPQATLPSLPSLPLVSSAFDALEFSVEISGKLRIFSLWMKRSIRFIQKRSGCPRR
ncbi:uncharacterized protein [Eucyclogobius newberryi]|uniref:uncharacterized protein n=1 Tax=Eucyclogobius newberryi TaxID=166745 RepID=UPI003B5C6434